MKIETEKSLQEGRLKCSVCGRDMGPYPGPHNFFGEPIYWCSDECYAKWLAEHINPGDGAPERAREAAALRKFKAEIAEGRKRYVIPAMEYRRRHGLAYQGPGPIELNEDDEGAGVETFAEFLGKFPIFQKSYQEYILTFTKTVGVLQRLRPLSQPGKSAANNTC